MPTKPTKIETILKLLRRPNGASIAQLQKTDGWQPHSVRAALTGLRKKGHNIERDKDAKGVNPARFRIFASVLASKKLAIEAFFRLDFGPQESGTVVRSRNETGSVLRPPGPGLYPCRAVGGGRPCKGRGPRWRTTP